MLKQKLKQKYQPVNGVFDQAFTDAELSHELVLKHKETIKQWLEAITMARMYSAQYGNLLQYIEENNIKIEGYDFIKTLKNGGYWS